MVAPALLLLAEAIGLTSTACVVSGWVKSCKAIRGREHSGAQLFKKRPAPDEGPSAHLFGKRYVMNRRGMYIFRRFWRAEKPNGQAVVIVHGSNEHMGRYENMAAALNAAGFDVYGMDLEGHGATEGDRMFLPDRLEVIEDILQLVRDASGPSGRKVMAIGHSLGALLLTQCALEAPELFHAVVLSGPCVAMDPKAPKCMISCMKSLGSLFPKAGLPALDPQTICVSSDVARQFTLDSVVCHIGLRLGTLVGIFSGFDYIAANIGSFSPALLLQHGTKDKLVPLFHTEWMAPLVKSTTKETLLYEGWGHEVYNECDADAVPELGLERDPASGVTTNRAVRDAVAWLSARAAEM